jgi:hypothetical protein
MKRSVLRAVVLGSAFVLAALPVKAEEKKISPGELPEAVIKAVKKRFHAAEIRGASKETGKKGTVFEVALKRGREELEVSLNPEGKILEIESKIDVKDLPEHIRKSIKHKYPGAKLTKVEKIQKGDEEPSYEVVVAPKSFEVKVDHHGKLAGDRKDGDDDEDEDEEHEHGVKAKGEHKERHEGKHEKDEDEDEDEEHEHGHGVKAKGEHKERHEGKHEKDEDEDEDEEHEHGHGVKAKGEHKERHEGKHEKDEDEDEEHEHGHGVKAKGERGDRHAGDNETHEHGSREWGREGGRFNGRDRRDDERGPRGRRWERRRDRDDD